MLRLVNLYAFGDVSLAAMQFLYTLMQEREPEINISHKVLPSFSEHCAFVKGHPFRLWYLIGIPQHSATHEWIGFISATYNNEIGIVLSKQWRGHGYGPEAIRQFIKSHQPLPPVSAHRAGGWVANIAPGNAHSLHVFTKLGFRKIQETFALPEEETYGYSTEEASAASA